jgi:hypothetical protein
MNDKINDNSMMVFPFNGDWFPTANPELMNWPLLFVPAWRDKADLVVGDMPLDPQDLRRLSALCLQVAEYIEERADNAED